jgi:hypothetical protein
MERRSCAVVARGIDSHIQPKAPLLIRTSTSGRSDGAHSRLLPPGVLFLLSAIIQ